jgi:hypothetical protein
VPHRPLHAGHARASIEEKDAVQVPQSWGERAWDDLPPVPQLEERGQPLVPHRAGVPATTHDQKSGCTVTWERRGGAFHVTLLDDVPGWKFAVARVLEREPHHRDATHRLAWIMTRGPIPLGACVLHKCDRGRCIHPGHLFLGTQRDNMIDIARKRPCHDEACPNGHVYTPESTVMVGRYRRCTICRAENERRRTARRRERRLAQQNLQSNGGAA